MDGTRRSAASLTPLFLLFTSDLHQRLVCYVAILACQPAPAAFFGAHAATPCSSRIVLRWFFQKDLDFALEGIFVHHTGMQVGNFAVAIDEHAYRHSFVHAEFLRRFKGS